MMLSTDWPAYGMPADAVRGICAVSGIFDLEPVRHTYVNQALGMTAEEAFENSPSAQPLRNSCPVILAHGDNETGEFKRQSAAYAARLAATGVPVTMKEIKGRNHFDVILDLCESHTWLSRAVLAQMGIVTAQLAN
jgi:arylformamidase